MKKLNYSLFVASMMLVAMSLASCKSSNKPAAETLRIGEIPEALQDIVGLEKYNTVIDYSQAENWLDVPAAMVKDGALDAAAADSLKAVDVFYVYPTVTGFRPETEVCDMTDTTMIAGAQMVRQIQTAVFDESCNVFMPYYRQISMPKLGMDYPAIIGFISQFDITDALDYYFISINPINWKLDDTYADAKENLGSLTVEGKLVTPGIADARVDTVRGCVIVTTADAKLYAIPDEGAQMFGPECYHLHDYGFFFNNLKQNVADRIKAFIEK